MGVRKLPAEPPIRVLVVDDHPMVREGLRSMLTADGVEVVGEAASGADALRDVRERSPDVVLLDLELPDLDGVTVLARLKESAPRIPVLVVSMHDETELVRRAIDAGAAGYILKGAGRRELLASVRAVRDGGSVLDPALLRGVTGLGEREPLSVARGPAGEAPSPVERELLRLIAQGLTNREIAARLRWSPATVKKYVQRILEKLGVSDRTQAAVEALRRGWLD